MVGFSHNGREVMVQRGDMFEESSAFSMMGDYYEISKSFLWIGHLSSEFFSHAS
jgi:hypothetical protein